jgi:hypothetical protein
MCVECDPNLLAASAGAIAPPDNSLAKELVSHYYPSERGWPWLFHSLEDFSERRPYYGEQLVQRVRDLHLFPEPWKPQDAGVTAVLQLPRKSQELLIAALAISKLYGLQSPPKPLRVLESILPSDWRLE